MRSARRRRGAGGDGVRPLCLREQSAGELLLGLVVSTEEAIAGVGGGGLRARELRPVDEALGDLLGDLLAAAVPAERPEERRDEVAGRQVHEQWPNLRRRLEVLEDVLGVEEPGEARLSMRYGGRMRAGGRTERGGTAASVEGTERSRRRPRDRAPCEIDRGRGASCSPARSRSARRNARPPSHRRPPCVVFAFASARASVSPLGIPRAQASLRFASTAGMARATTHPSSATTAQKWIRLSQWNPRRTRSTSSSYRADDGAMLPPALSPRHAAPARVIPLALETGIRSKSGEGDRASVRRRGGMRKEGGQVGIAWGLRKKACHRTYPYVSMSEELIQRSSKYVIPFSPVTDFKKGTIKCRGGL